jgi:F0F1-type ATP synthase assembly protein I
MFLGALSMSDELSKEILDELKKMNEKLDNLNEPNGLSTPMKIVALFFGFMVIGPFIALLLSRLFH